MNIIIAIIKKELSQYFNSPIAYVFIATFLAISGWIFWNPFFINGQADMRQFFNILPWVFLFLIPALTMRLWSEERKTGSIDLLLSLPATTMQIITGKFLGAMSFLIICLGITLFTPISIGILGDPDWGVISGGYFGAILLGGCYIAIGMFASGLTKNQIVAFIVSAALSFAFLILGTDFVLKILSHKIAQFAQFISFSTHFNNIGRGVVDSRDLIYFACFIAFFIWLNLAKYTRDKKALDKNIGIFAVLTIIATINFFAQLWFARLDLTENKIFSLSAYTKESLENIDDIITIKAYFSSVIPAQYTSSKQDALDIIEEYKAFANGKIQSLIIDPSMDQAAKEYLQQLEIPEIQFNIFENEKYQVVSGYMGITIEYGDKQEIIPFIEKNSNLEYKLTVAIKKLLSDKMPTIGYISTAIPEDFNNALSAIEQNYVTYDALPILHKTSDTDISALLVVSQDDKMSEDAVKVIDDFFMSGKPIIILMNGVQIDGITASPNTNNPLITLLKNYGITINNDLVMDKQSGTATFTQGYIPYILQYPFWPQITSEGMNRDHFITASLNKVMLPWASSLEISASSTAENKILLQSSPNSYANNSDFDILPQQDFTKNEKWDGNYTLAVISKGSFKSPFTDKSTQNNHLIVVGDSDFINNNYATESNDNLSFLLNMVDSAVLDSGLSSIRPKQNNIRVIENASDQRKTLIKNFNIFVLPLAIILLGVIRYYIRKK